MFWFCASQAYAAEPLAFHVRHRHIQHGAEGVLRVGDDSISFQEEGNGHRDSRQWRYEDIEQLTLSPKVLRILTYEDRRWQLGRDREFVFDNLPKDLAAKLYPFFSGRLDQRFIAALADDGVKASWEIPAKLLHRIAGSQGEILVGPEHIVYRTESPEQSRTWRITDIQMVSSSGPFDLTVTTFERSGGNAAGRKDFQFQLKRPLTEGEYNGLWRRINQSQGLQILNSSNRQGEKQ